MNLTDWLLVALIGLGIAVVAYLHLLLHLVHGLDRRLHVIQIVQWPKWFDQGDGRTIKSN